MSNQNYKVMNATANFHSAIFPFPVAIPTAKPVLEKPVRKITRTRVIGISGNIVRVFDWDTQINTLHFHLQNLPEGIYLIRPDDGETRPIRWVVN